jgi:glycosyltransferase involved in cell wall biosynthesis
MTGALAAPVAAPVAVEPASLPSAAPSGGPAPPVTVSVVIPSFNRRDSLVEVLDALGRQTYPPDRFDVFVVLDGSRDGSEEMLAARGHAGGPPVTAIWQPNAGAGAARNHGAAAAGGDLLLFLDDDVVPEPQLIAAHAAAHREHPGDVVLGRMRFAARGRAGVVTDWDAEWYERHFADLARPE